MGDRVRESQVKEAINGLSLGKAPGYNAVTTDGLKLGIVAITPFLTRLVQACLDHRLFPNAFKGAITVMLRKPDKETYSSPKSWRPRAGALSPSSRLSVNFKRGV